MFHPSRDEKGIVGVILTIVIVWALIAVIELTRTTIAAEEINHTVLNITASVSSANNHLATGCAPGNCPLDRLPELVTTINIAGQINTAAAPLTGQLSQVIADTHSINNTVPMILQNAQSINATVQSIHSLVLSIGGSVNSINSELSGVNADVQQVGAPGGSLSVQQINRSVDVIIGLAQGIKSDTATINGQAGGILTEARGICADHPVNVASILPVLGPICTGG
ncbi:MAG: hypothetical protein ACRDZ8_14240 [Acidimicrobiales bacterium]